MNRRYMTTSAFMLHKYSVMKYYLYITIPLEVWPIKATIWWDPWDQLHSLLQSSFWLDVSEWCFSVKRTNPISKAYNLIRPDNLDYLMKRSSNAMQFPLNSLNQRTSAHYTEISTIYAAEMMKRVNYHCILSITKFIQK